MPFIALELNPFLNVTSLIKLMNSSYSGRGRAGSVHVLAGGGYSVEESVHGSAQCEEHAGGGAVQLGEVQLHCGLPTGLAGGC